MYTRILQAVIANKAESKKAIVLIGARQVGKTTLIKQVLAQKEYLLIDGDDPMVREVWDTPNTEKIKGLIGANKIIFIDEAQRINNIGLTVKIIIDQLQNVEVFISGSSAFYVQNSINEPLTGRKWEYELFPISWEEFELKNGYLKSISQLEQRIVYGMYPEVLTSVGEERLVLNQLVNSYLYKDVLEFSGIRKPAVINKLVKALAFQVGNEISYNELSRTVGIDKETVANYIQILEQAYIIFRLPAFSSNLRNEIKRNQKIYFYDTGVRNAIIADFSPFEIRQDKGVLWENFLLSERVKLNRYHSTFAQMYFWRTKQQQEVDYVEVVNGKVSGFEIKLNAKKNQTLPKTFINKYHPETYIIDKNNFRDFVIN